LGKRLVTQPVAGNDGEVVRAVLAGDIERYAELVRRYRDRYARYAARMLGSIDAAEDAVQDAFIRAYDQLSQCRDPDNFAGWFFLILRNRCFAEQRRNHRAGSVTPEMLDVASPREAPDGAMERSETRRALGRALQKLTQEQRDVFVLKHIEGMSYEQIATMIGASVPSLKMRMHRAYDRLREEMRDHL
jgi:RNA polymerase sigma-70 factor (ECF subfamily)